MADTPHPTTPSAYLAADPRGGLALAAALVAWLGAGCSMPEPTVHNDLASEAPSAEWLYPGGIRVVAAPPLTAPRVGDEAGSSWFEAPFFVDWPVVEPRLAVLDLELPEQAAPSLVVLLNDEEVANLEPESGRRRYRFPLPAEAQRPGRNRLAVRVSSADPAAADVVESSDPRVHGLAIGPAEDAGLVALAEHDVAPFSVNRDAGIPSLRQAAPLTLRFAVRLPDDAELRFTPRLSTDDPSEVPVRFCVTLELTAGGGQELWCLDLAAGDPASEEVTVPLPGQAGEPALLSLQVTSGAGIGLARGDWLAPRIMGRGPRVEPRAVRLAEKEASRGHGLEESLAESSVLLVVVGAAPARGFGCYGDEPSTTPEIDRLAREGVVFERAFTPAVDTPAAMASLWTSRYPDQHLAGGGQERPLPRELLTVTELLAAQGRHTVGFVADPEAGRAFGLDRGFAEFHEQHETDASAKALRGALEDWIESQAGARFLAYAQFREADSPATVDHELGLLRTALESAGVWQRTVVILVADHGEAEPPGERRLKQPAVRVPLVVRFPEGKGPSGLRLGQLVDLLDVAPTVAEIFGLLGKGGSAEAFEGRSLLAVVEGAPGKAAILTRTSEDGPVYGLFDGSFKLVHDLGRGTSALYDLTADPGEETDIGDRQPIAVELYRQALHRWLRELARETGSADAQELTPEELETLRALGYVS